MKQLFLLFFATAALWAADATGSWRGNLLLQRAEGEAARPAYLVLKQEGAKLTGTAGPNEDEQHPIQNGKVEDGMLVFEVAVGEATMKFNLKHSGDEINGEITRERDGNTEKAKLAVKREK